MERHARIYVAGHRGLVGSAVLRALRERGCQAPILREQDQLDLREQADVREFFQAERPDYVFLCAARVGGILANSSYPAEFLYDNIALQTHVIHEAWRAGVRRLLFLGSSCIYPRDCPQPMREEHLLTGPLEPTNRPYALAKIAGIEQVWDYNRQYGARYLAAMPTNLYGPNDNFDLEKSHVLPAIIRKMHEARQAGSDRVTLWGTGAPRREFLYSEDLADALLFLMEQPDEKLAPILDDPDQPPLLNIGCGEDQTIAELATLVAEVVGFDGRIEWDRSKPDGTPRKLLDVSRLQQLGWRPRTPLREGIALAYQAFLEKQN